jgi:autotransporter translocation and assembly factor TamB
MSGTVTVDARLGGTMQNPKISAKLYLQEVRYEDQGPFTMRLEASYDDERFEIDRLEFSVRSIKVLPRRPQLQRGIAEIPVALTLEGDYELHWDRPIFLNIVVAPIGIEAIARELPQLADLDPRGWLGGQLKLDGTLGAPKLSVEFDLEQFGMEGSEELGVQQITDLNAEFVFSYDAPGGDELRLRAQASQAGTKLARISMRGAPLPAVEWARATVRGEELELRSELMRTDYRLQIEVPELQVRDLPLIALREADAAGVIDLDVDLSGKLLDPRGTVEMHVDGFGYEGFRDNYVDLDAKLADQKLQIDNLFVQIDFDESKEFRPTRERPGEIYMMASGTLPMPVEAIYGDATLENMPVDFTVQLSPETIPVRALSTIDYDFARIKGAVGGYIKMGGTLRKPEFRGRFALYDTELGEKNREEKGTIAVSIDARDNVVSTEALVCLQDTKKIWADARLPLNLDLIALSEGGEILRSDGPNSELYAHVESDDLQLRRVVPEKLVESVVRDVRGRLDIDATVRGSWDNLTPTGYAKLSGGALTLPAFGRRFEEIQTDVQMSERRIRLASFEVHEDRGVVRMQGRLDHRDLRLKSMQATLETREFNVDFGAGMPIYITSKTDITGDLDRPLKKIDVDVGGLTVDIPQTGSDDLHQTELAGDIVVLDDKNPYQIPTAAQELFATAEARESRFRALVDISLADDSRINIPFGHVYVVANDEDNLQLNLEGTSFNLTGRVRTTRGDVEFLGKEFTISEGFVGFTGAPSPNPRLQIEAIYLLERELVSEIGEPSQGRLPRVSVTVTGTASTPDLVLSSDPVMSKTDIVYVLVTGRPPDSAEVGQQVGVANKALGAASSFVANKLKEQIPSTFSPDVLKIEAGEEGLSTGRLEIGKYITEDLLVSYHHNFGSGQQAKPGEMRNVIEVEYYFAPRWMVAGEFGDAAAGGGVGQVNVFWDVF